MSFTIRAAKSNFFDRKAVMAAVDKARLRVLSKFGAYVRTTARRSIRKRKRVSDAGSPPSSHTGRLRDFLFFAYDPRSESVVIGPAKLNSTNAPEALEHGGAAAVLSRGRRKTAHIRARPFMGPAFAKELPGFDELWRDSVK